MVEVSPSYNNHPSAASIKILGLIFFASAVTLAAGYFLAHSLFLYGLLGLIFFLVLFSLEVIFFSDRNHLILAVFVNALALAIPFYQSFSIELFAAWVALIVFLYLAALGGKKEMKGLMKIQTFRIVRALLWLTIAALVIFLAVALLLQSGFSLTEERTNFLVNKTLGPALRNYVPDFSASMKTEIFLNKLAENSLAANSFKYLSPLAKKQKVAESAADLRGRIEKLTGVELEPQKSVGENINKIILAKFSRLTPSAKIYWTIIVALLLWLTVKGIEAVVVLPIGLLTFLFYEFLLALNFAAIRLETRSQEVIALD
jgi:hypothetical protein